MSNIDRREFLKLVGAGSVGMGSGFMLSESTRHPLEHLIPSVVPPEDFSPGIATWYNSVCNMCNAGCGISVRCREGRAKKIEGNPSHPVNQGRLCALGQAGLQVLYNPDRITAPLSRTLRRNSTKDKNRFEQITWEEGLSKIAGQLNPLLNRAQGNRVCLISQGVRGHLSTVLELFMQQLGSSRLWHYDLDHPHALYAANQLLFGESALPYYDLKNARFLLSFGADYLGRWISPVHHGLSYGHSRQGSDTRSRIVQIEPRMSLSGAAADQWLAANPGTEGFLALAIARHIIDAGYYQGIDRDDWAHALKHYSTEWVAAQTGINNTTLLDLAETFATTQPSLAIGGSNLGLYSNSTDTLVAVNVLNYLVGNLGKAGGLMFNPKPTVGPLSHLRQASFRDITRLSEDAHHGLIDVVIINNTNPVFTLPAAAKFKQALADVPLVVSLSSFMDETTAMADLILPSHTYLESWGDDFPEPGVGFAVGTLSQPVVSPLYNTRATGDIVLDLAKRLGFSDVLPWANMKDCLKAGWKDIFHRSESAEQSHLSQEENFEAFWRAVLKSGVWGEKTKALQPGADLDNATTTSIDNHRKVISKQFISHLSVDAPEFAGNLELYPFILYPYLSNTLHDGRGANLPWMQELPDTQTSIVYGTWVEVNPSTAKRLTLSEGDVVQVASAHGRIKAPVFIYNAIMPNVVAVPIGQGHSVYGRYAKNRGANPLQILAPLTDHHTGCLAASATRVQITATGQTMNIVKTGGTSRDLGRGIIQTIGPKPTDKPKLISIKEIPT
jgi:anaerobic selenocysteine-containing dehydrogenase